MTQPKLLIANRGEIAIRIARAAAELGLPTVGIHAADDANNLHVQQVDEAVPLAGSGVAAYLDGQQIVKIAQQMGCTLLHPGYGFLSENGRFAHHCHSHNLTFIGPRPDILETCGDKTATRQLAAQLNIPIIPGTPPASLDDALAFFQQHPGGIMIKAVAGGGGRGMRLVRQIEKLPIAWARCQSEAQQAFGNPALYVEKWLPQVRHIEVQIVGDGTGAVCQLGERDCSIQRQQQKLIEIAPAPDLPAGLRDRLGETAVSLAQQLHYNSLGTVEFLVDGTTSYLIEINPRLQVEHTVTETIYGLDLVQIQIQLALGHSLADLGLTPPPSPRGQAMQLRLNAESLADDGTPRPSSGTLTRFELPSGIGLRVDSHGHAGYTNSLRYDSLLAKLICHVHSPTFASLTGKGSRALADTQIDGLTTNQPLLQAILQHPHFIPAHLHTRWLDQHLPDLLAHQINPKSKIQNLKSKI